MSGRFRVMVLGGYGRFGEIIARRLAQDSRLHVCVAGRDAARAQSLAREIGGDARAIDLDGDAWQPVMAQWQPNLVVSTVGPFQGQDYRIARAAIARGSHYADLADARRFVCDIARLEGEARARDCLVVSGASSVPALSGAVLDHLSSKLARIESIDLGISTSSRMPGAATVRATMSYCGMPFEQWHEGRWTTRFGWQGLRSHVFLDKRVKRWVCDCDVPDLEIFPARYGARSVRFGAGTEGLTAQLGLWVLSWAARARLLSVSRLTSALMAAGRRLERFGSGRSRFFAVVTGTDADDRKRTLRWELRARQEHGSVIPAMAVVALARKLAGGEVALRGATPCVGLITLQEYMDELREYEVTVHEQEQG